MLPDFKNEEDLPGLIDTYFEHISGEYHLKRTAVDNEDNPISKKIWDREPEPATFSELAYFLGFNSHEEFEEYKQTGKFSKEVNRAWLRIQVVYEKKLHNQSPTGAIFALNGLGRKEKAITAEHSDTLKVLLIETGPKPVENEKDVVF
jgi:hypothetical protein